MEYLGDGAWDTPAGETPTPSITDPGSVALTDVLERWDVVEAHVKEDVDDQSYIIMTDRGYGQTLPMVRNVRLAGADTMDMRELGSSSPSPWTSWMREEQNSELRGEFGLAKYLSMKRSDGTVRGSLRLFKTPVVGARWYMKPGSEKSRDVTIADRINQMLIDDMTQTWPQTLNEILLMADYGHSILEKVWKEYDDGFLGWQKLAPRHPMDVQTWVWDKNGGIAGLRMKSEKSAEGLWIPIEKLLIFTMDVESGDLRGTSLLRSAYKHWYYKENLYKIDAIQKERHGIGVPIIKLPPGFNEADKRLAEDLGRNLRTNERAHIVLPYNWEVMFAKLEGHPVDALASVDHHDMQIQKNILAPFMGDGMDDKKQSLFMKSTKYIANSITAIINKHGIREIVDKNFVRKPGYPTLEARRIGEWEDLRTLSFALRNLIGANIIRPDDKLEAAMREEFDLPLADPDTVRLPPVPQAGPAGADGAPAAPKAPEAGPPRQATAGNQKIGPQSPAAGRDTSGGK